MRVADLPPLTKKMRAESEDGADFPRRPRGRPRKEAATSGASPRAEPASLPAVTVVETGRAEMPPLPADFLFPHQARALDKFKEKSGLVCFEMGTGKTLTALAIVHHAFSKNKEAPSVLFVGPQSALDALRGDLARLEALGVRLRMAVLSDSCEETLEDVHIVFSTYSVISRSWGCFVNPIVGSKSRLDVSVHQWLWNTTHSLVVLDEAHAICNPTTANYKAAMALKAEQRVGLSGTPIMNSPRDFDSLRKWLRAEKDAEIGDIMVTATHTSVAEERGLRGVEVHRYSLTCGFQHEGERTLHRAVLNRLADRLHLDVTTEENPFGLSGDSLGVDVNGEPTSAVSAFAALTRARQACLVPALANDQLKDDAWATTHSTKLNMLAYYLRTYEGRVVIMTFFVSAFPFIKKRIAMEEFGEVVEYHGGMKQQDREAALRTWRARSGKPGGPRILLATIGSAGVSLNLQSERLVLLEPMYNPQRERQAASRIVRMEGLNEVTITNMMITGSIEECIWMLARDKADMADRLMKARRFNPENIQNFILRPLNKAQSRQVLGMRDQEAAAHGKSEQITSDLGELDDEAVRPSAVSSMIQQYGKTLADLSQMNLMQRIFIQSRGEQHAVISIDPNMEVFGSEEAIWSYFAYQTTFLAFDTLDEACKNIHRAFGEPISVTSHADFTRCVKNYFIGTPVSGIWITEEQRAMLFFPDTMLREV